MEEQCIGIDYGTDSVRIILAGAGSGLVCAEAVAAYPRWKRGLWCDPAESRFRQHPLDYLESLETAMNELRAKAPPGAFDAVRGIGVDATGSTPVAVDAEGLPLSLRPEFAEDPDAMFILWKDHSAIDESEDINRALAAHDGENFARYSGGAYSPEWFWSKILRVVRRNQAVGKAAATWVEHSDWMPAWLTGNRNPATWTRNRCAAGHKAMWHASWGGLPSEEFLVGLEPRLAGLRARLYETTVTAERPAGTLDPALAAGWGLPSSVIVAAGAIDAHVGAVGGGIGPGDMLKIMGTSTCDMIVAKKGSATGRPIRGICGQVDGSILPGFEGLEAGQSAFGDAYAWLRSLISDPLLGFAASCTGTKDVPGGANFDHETVVRFVEAYRDELLSRLSDGAALRPVVPGAPIALDWLNGRRTPDVDPRVEGAFVGLSLGADAVELFRALVEATAFGSRRILERFEEEGVGVSRVIATGGVARESPYIMRVVADVMRRPVFVIASDQAMALGAAMLAAVASGIHPDAQAAQAAMGGGMSAGYEPDPGRAAIYDERYGRYLALGGFAEEYAHRTWKPQRLDSERVARPSSS